jgi:hypothetical protein
MAFTLETLRAKHGDALLLHYGAKKRVILIDGGPAGVYKATLKKRLDQLRGTKETLDLRLIMVSHIDDDHIRGILDLLAELEDADADQRPRPWNARTIWINTFDDLVGQNSEELRTAAIAAIGDIQLADLENDVFPSGLSEHTSLMLASVGQGRRLRQTAGALGMAFNATPSGMGGLLIAGDGAPKIDLGDGLSFRILGPSKKRLEELRVTWDKEVAKKLAGQAASLELAEYLDKSVFNLASLVIWAEHGGKTMLLTGDARGDDVLEGLEAAGLLAPGGQVEVDLLKLPHHGSDRNVDLDFFQRIKAKNYVASGDGKHDNPEPAMFNLLFSARQNDPDPFKIFMTYAVGELKEEHAGFRAKVQAALDQAQAAGVPFEVVTPALGELGVVVAL